MSRTSLTAVQLHSKCRAGSMLSSAARAAWRVMRSWVRPWEVHRRVFWVSVNFLLGVI